MRKRNIHAFDAVDGSSHRHRERLLAVPSDLIEQHDGVGVGVLRAAGGAIEEYVHGVGIDLGEDEREGIISGRPPGGLEVGGNEALVGEARRTLTLRSCVCIGGDSGGGKQNEKGFHNLTQARREHRARLQRSGTQAV
jgi:hypothetical protein